MVKFSKIFIKNFMSIGEAELSLDTGGFTLIKAVNHRVEDSAGSNGSGKSSIAESILWCLTGETIRGHKDVVNRYTTGDCEVRLEFSFKGQNWAVERAMSRSREKSLSIYKNSILLESKGYRDSQEILSRELPELTDKFINSVVILGQGLPGRFTNNTPSGRKAVLEELTNADFMITQLKESIKNRMVILSESLRSDEDGLLRSETQLDMSRSRLEELEKEMKDLETVDLDKFRSKRAELELKVSELDNELKENELLLVKALDESNRLRDEWKDCESKMEVELSLIRERLSKGKSELAEKYSEKISSETLSIEERLLKGGQMIKEVEDRIRDRKSKITGGVCKTCGRVMDNMTQGEIDLEKSRVAADEETLTQYRKLYDEIKSSEYSISVRLRNDESREVAELRAKLDTESLEVTKKYGLMSTNLKSGYQASRDESSRLSLRRGKISEDLRLAKEALLSVSSRIDNHLSEVDRVSGSIMQTNESISLVNDKISAYQSSVDELKSRISVVKQMDVFASRDFRGILLEDIILRMNEIVGKYSEVVYGNRLTNFYLSGNTIQIEFDGKEYESLSGGEQQKINVILQLSLRDLIVELTGNTGSILFLDEIFDGLDSVGCEKMVELVQGLDTSTFVISHHHEHLNLPYDYVLTVVKEQNGVAHIEVEV